MDITWNEVFAFTFSDQIWVFDVFVTGLEQKQITTNKTSELLRYDFQEKQPLKLVDIIVASLKDMVESMDHFLFDKAAKWSLRKA